MSKYEKNPFNTDYFITVEGVYCRRSRVFRFSLPQGHVLRKILMFLKKFKSASNLCKDCHRENLDKINIAVLIRFYLQCHPALLSLLFFSGITIAQLILFSFKWTNFGTSPQKLTFLFTINAFNPPPPHTHTVEADIVIITVTLIQKRKYSGICSCLLLCFTENGQ